MHNATAAATTLCVCVYCSKQVDFHAGRTLKQVRNTDEENYLVSRQPKNKLEMQKVINLKIKRNTL